MRSFDIVHAKFYSVEKKLCEHGSCAWFGIQTLLSPQWHHKCSPADASLCVRQERRCRHKWEDTGRLARTRGCAPTTVSWRSGPSELAIPHQTALVPAPTCSTVKPVQRAVVMTGEWTYLNCQWPLWTLLLLETTVRSRKNRRIFFSTNQYNFVWHSFYIGTTL